MCVSPLSKLLNILGSPFQIIASVGQTTNENTHLTDYLNMYDFTFAMINNQKKI